MQENKELATLTDRLIKAYQSGESQNRRPDPSFFAAALLLDKGQTMESVASVANTIFQATKGISANQGDEKAIVCDNKGQCRAK